VRTRLTLSRVITALHSSHQRQPCCPRGGVAAAVILAGGGEAPNAKSILCQYDDCTCIEVGLDIEKVVHEYLSLRFGYTALATEQDNARIRCTTCSQQFSEISVSRHHRSRLGKSGPDDRIVWCAEQAAVAGVHRVMARVDQQRAQPRAQALIDQES